MASWWSPDCGWRSGIRCSSRPWPMPARSVSGRGRTGGRGGRSPRRGRPGSGGVGCCWGGGALRARASAPGCGGGAAGGLAYALLGRGKRAQALELVEDTLRRGPTVVPWAARLRALWGVLIVDEHQQFDVARDTAEEVIAEGEQTGDRCAVGFGLHVLSMVAEADTKLAYVDRALTVVADHLDGADLRLLLSSNKAGVLMSLGRTDEAEHTIREALTLAEQTGTPRMLTLRSRAAKIYYSLGRWDDALVELEIAAELLEDRPVTAYAAVDVHSLAAL